MKKPGDERFEKELLQALRGPLRAQERNAARTRVSQRLSATLSHLEAGAASALPLLLEAPSAAAAQTAAGVAASSKALAGASIGVGGAAAGAGTGAAVAATHPLGVLLTAFALGAGAGGGAFVALSPGHVFERGTASHSTAQPAPSASAAVRQRSRGVPSRVSDAREFLDGKEPASAASSSALALAAGSVLRDSLEVPRASTAGSPAPRRALPGREVVKPEANPVTSKPQADTLTAQQALLDRARAALARGESGGALAALAEHARTQPASELVEEREALTIKSLIASGDSASARVRAASFEGRYPRSLFLPSIRSALAKNP